MRRIRIRYRLYFLLTTFFWLMAYLDFFVPRTFHCLALGSFGWASMLLTSLYFTNMAMRYFRRQDRMVWDEYFDVKQCALCKEGMSYFHNIITFGCQHASHCTCLFEATSVANQAEYHCPTCDICILDKSKLQPPLSLWSLWRDTQFFELFMFDLFPLWITIILLRGQKDTFDAYCS